MRKLFVCLLGFLFVLTACVSSPKVGQATLDKLGEETIISRSDDRTSRPDWLKEESPFKIEDGQVLALGMASIPDGHRLEAAYRLSDNNGKVTIASAIEQKLEMLFQNAEEGTGLDSTQARYISSEATRLTSNSIRIDKHYWEKYRSFDENGSPIVRYRVFSQVIIPEKDFKLALLNAVRKSQGQKGLSEDFSEKVNKQWEQFANPEKPVSLEVKEGQPVVKKDDE